jgi:hypothetical protein
MYLGIGCGLLALIGIVILVLGVGWGARKVGGLLSDLQANPDKFAAEMIVKSDPNLELVTSDEGKGEITYRDRTTGRTTTLTYGEAAKGNIGRGSEVSGGTVTAPAGVWNGAPSWFPVMDGLVLGGTELHTANDTRESIHLTATSTAPTDDIVAFYSDELDRLGFTIARHSQTAGSLVNEQIEAVDRAGGRRVTINVTRPQPDAPAGLVVTIETGTGP